MDERANGTASWEELSIIRIDESRRYRRSDRLIREEAYTLYINEQRIYTFACTPIDLEDLAAGYAFAEGFFNSKAEIQSLSVDRDAQEIRLSLFSFFSNFSNLPKENFSKEKEKIESLSSEYFSKEKISEEKNEKNEKFKKEKIYALWEIFNEKSNLFHITGAVHAMALTDSDTILILREDAARHNAAAKTIGRMVLDELDPAGKAFMFSGRLSLNLCRMVERTGVKVLLCHGAVTSSAVRQAEAAGITLAGFLRRGYMNIYSHSGRITD
jgi:FdhD protein